MQVSEIDIFPFLSLPSIVTDGILRKLALYELFSISMHPSEEARNIVRTFTKNHQFYMIIGINDSCLRFNYEGVKTNKLVLAVSSESKSTEHILKFNGISENVYADIKTDKNGTTFCTYWKENEKENGLKILIEHMSSVFNNISIEVDFDEWGDVSYAKILKNTIKKLNFKIDYYRDAQDVHTFKELESLILCKTVNVSYCELTKEELKKLFDKWMKCENPGHIILGDLGNFKLEDLFSGNVIEYDITDITSGNYLEVTRSDGIKAKIMVWSGKFFWSTLG